MLLLLDEKKIRKGKPVGLPYVGSKKKIAKKIVEIIKQNFGVDKPVYDIFGGGGAITAECMLNGLEVHYNDLDKTITDCFQRVVTSDREYLKTLLCSRAEFLEIREKEDKTVDDELKLLVNSFGNDRKGYLYGKDVSDLKYNLAIEIIGKHDCFSGYRQTETYKQAVHQAEQLEQLQQLQPLQQLEQMQRLQSLERTAQLQRLDITNLDYKAFSDVEGAIFYLDPPYENTNHKSYSIDCFGSKSFYDWAFEMSKRNIVLISSYEISDPRFEVVYEFKTARSTIQSGTANNRYEKLFMAK